MCFNEQCVPNVVKNMNLKVFNLMSWNDQTKQIKWLKVVNVNVD